MFPRFKRWKQRYDFVAIVAWVNRLVFLKIKEKFANS